MGIALYSTQLEKNGSIKGPVFFHQFPYLLQPLLQDFNASSINHNPSAQNKRKEAILFGQPLNKEWSMDFLPYCILVTAACQYSRIAHGIDYLEMDIE